MEIFATDRGKSFEQGRGALGLIRIMTMMMTMITMMMMCSGVG